MHVNGVLGVAQYTPFVKMSMIVSAKIDQDPLGRSVKDIVKKLVDLYDMRESYFRVLVSVVLTLTENFVRLRL